MDRGSTSVQSKTKSLTPFRLRSKREDLAQLCRQHAAVSTVPDAPHPAADRHRAVAESISTSPQIAGRAPGQRLMKTTAAGESTGSTASLDARSRPDAPGNLSCGPRTLSATHVDAPAAEGSEYGSLESVDRLDRRRQTAAGAEADASSTVESDAADQRRRRRAELVRARTAGEWAGIDGSEAAERPGEDGARPGQPLGDQSTPRRLGVSTSSSCSTPSLHLPAKSSTTIDEAVPVAPSFLPTQWRTPWRSIRSASDTAHDDVPPSRPCDHRSRHVVTGDHHQIAQTTPVSSTLAQSPSSAVVSSRSSHSTTSAEGVKHDRDMETRLKMSMHGSASSVAASKTEETAAAGSDVGASATAESSRAKPRITIYSSDTRDRDTAQRFPGHDAVLTKDRFNVLLGKAIESTTSSTGGHHHQLHQEASTKPQHKPASAVDQYIHEKATPLSTPTMDDEKESSISTARPLYSSPVEPSLKRFGKEPTTTCSIKTTAAAVTQNVATDLTNTAVNKDKVPHRSSRVAANGQRQPSKQYISDSSAIVSVATQSTAGNTADNDQCKKSGNVEIPSESVVADRKPESNVPSRLPANLNKEPRYDTHKHKHSENRLDQTHSAGSRSRQPNIMEETQIVQILSFGGNDAVSRSSNMKNAETPLIGEESFSHKSDTVSPQFYRTENKSSDIYSDKHISELPSEERSAVSQTQALSSCADNEENGDPTMSLEHFPDTNQRSVVATGSQLNSNSVSSAVDFKEPSQLTDDSLSADIKLSTVASRQVHQADVSCVPPWFEQEVRHVREPERQTAVVQEVGMAAEQELFGEREIGLERVKPRNVDPVRDVRRYLQTTACQYHANRLTLADSETGRQKSYFDSNAEKVGRVEDLVHLEQVKPRLVEPYSTDQRRFLTKTVCRNRADVLTLAASEASGDGCRKCYVDPSAETLGHVDAQAQFERVQPQNFQLTFPFVDAGPHLRKTRCHYRTKLLTFHPADDDVVVQTGLLRKPLDKAREMIGKIEGLKPESPTSSVVEDVTVRKSGETVKVVPIPQILTMMPQLRQRAGSIFKSKEFSPPVFGKKMERKGVPTEDGRKAAPPRSDTGTFPVSQQQLEITQSFYHRPRTTDSTQSTTTPVTPSDTASPRFQVRRSSDGFAKSVALVGQSVDGGQQGLESVCESLTRETSSGQNADVRWINRTQSQDRTSVLQPCISDEKQLQKPVDFVSATPHAVDTSSIVTLKPSGSNRTSVSSDLSVSSRKEKTISLSNDAVGRLTSAAADTRDTAVVEQHRAKFPRTDSSDTNVSAKRDSTKKARNILRSREDFLALQTPTFVDETTRGDVETTGCVQLEASPTARRTTDPAKKDVVNSQAESRPELGVKIALREDDVVDDHNNDERLCQAAAAADSAAKAAFPPLVSGRSWDAIVRSSSMDDPASPGGVEPRRTAPVSRAAFSAARSETTVGVPDATSATAGVLEAPRSIPQTTESVDLESSMSGTINIHPQLAANDDGTLDAAPDGSATKTAFPRLVSWDNIVRSSSVDEPSSPGGVDRRAAEPRRTAAASRVAFSAARAETTIGVAAEAPRTPRPILEMAKSVDLESSLPGTVNIDPQLAAVLRMRKQREEEQEREEAAMKVEEAVVRY